MASFALIRQAIVTALAAASGLPESSIFWQFQNVNAPDVDYLAITLSSLQTVGQDSVLESFDKTRSAGQEFAEQVLGVREATLQVEVFSASVVSSASPASVDAEERAEQARTKLILPSIRDPLFAVGFVPFDPGPVQYLPAIVNAGFRGRATCDIRCRMPAQAYVEYVGYIAEVRGTITIPSADATSPIVIPFDSLGFDFEFDGPAGSGFDDGFFEE